MTRIRITIDELILDGAAELDRAQLVKGLQEALAQRIDAQGLPSPLDRGQISGHMPVTSAETVARHIADIIYGGSP